MSASIITTRILRASTEKDSEVALYDGKLGTQYIYPFENKPVDKSDIIGK